eukprot:541406-Prymnesium_polylepis.1
MARRWTSAMKRVRATIIHQRSAANATKKERTGPCETARAPMGRRRISFHGVPSDDSRGEHAGNENNYEGTPPSGSGLDSKPPHRSV